MKPILLIEDDKLDRLNIQRIFTTMHVMNPLEIAYNGAQALAMLHEPDRERPCLILLDLYMPEMSGLDFLQTIKSDSELKRIPVVVLTSSREDEDKQQSFELGVAGYLVKPTDSNKLLIMLNALHMYWTLNELPEK